MQLYRVIFGVGLMITGAILFLTCELGYVIKFCSPNILVDGLGALWYIGLLMILIGFFVALHNCKCHREKEDQNT